MFAAYLLQFFASLVIVGTMIRFVELKYPESWIGRSLAVVY